LNIFIAQQDDLKHGTELVSLLTESENQEIKDIKMSLSVYCKQFYRVVSSAGYNSIDIPKTLSHIELLFKCFESNAIELKAKYSIFGAMENMVMLYKYQENAGAGFDEHIDSILKRIEQMAVQGMEQANGDTLKSSFMLTEVMFSIGQDQTQLKIISVCISKLYHVIDQQMISLNADILALNNSLKQDQLHFTRENPLVGSIMQKIDIIGAFIKMMYRVFEKVTTKTSFLQAYYQFVASPHLASIFIRVFGIGIQIPNSPNNNSVINITGLQILDNVINQLKTKSLECINYLLKKKDKQCEALIAANQHQVLNGLRNLIPMMIQSLIIFGQRSDLEQLLDEETISNFVVEALENLSLTTLYDSFKEVFFRFLPNLVLDVGLNLIKTTEAERQ
jgi:hypothetical protein